MVLYPLTLSLCRNWGDYRSSTLSLLISLCLSLCVSVSLSHSLYSPSLYATLSLSFSPALWLDLLS